jgi:hypothetical protein
MIILNFQFWDGDKAQAMALARLVADLQPTYRDDVTVLFSARFDCVHDDETIGYVSQKFPTKRFTSKTRSTGWPAGCNRLMADSYQHCIEMVRMKEVVANGVMFIESDCVPLHKNWLDMILEEWKNCGKMVLGAWLKQGDASGEHINGNCIMHIDFWKQAKMIINPPTAGGWDATCAAPMLKNGYPSKLIWSDYHLGKTTNPWKGCGYLWQNKRYSAPSNAYYGQDLRPVWYHGPKDMRGLECVRNRLLGPSIWTHRDQLGDVLNARGLTWTGVELGVFKGEFAETILSKWKGQRLILVDPWVKQEGYLDGCNDIDFPSALEETKARMSKFGSRADIQQRFGHEMDVPNEALDFVFIDARHDYESVKADIAMWWPKIRPGGVLCGHDYLHQSIPGVFNCGVTEAVDEFVNAEGLRLHVTTEDVKSWLVTKD